jgi:glycosyltransferase involved in cell wall biosynthesis
MTTPRPGGPLRVVWLATAPIERTARGYSSPRASLRYRMTIPSAALERMGCESAICFLPPDADARQLLAPLKKAQVVIVGKIWYHPDTLPMLVPPLLSLLDKLRASGVKVIADFCDDAFDDRQRGTFDIGLASSVDAVVASTPALAEVLRTLTHAPVTTITDPVEGERGEPRVPAVLASREPLGLLWFGHPSNFDSLMAGLRELEPAAAESPFSLTALTTPGLGKEKELAALDQAWRPAGRACRFRPWSAQATFEALRECDAVIIPSAPQDPAKAVKSPNRFTESVWAGRFVVAHPLPAYLPLAECGWVGEDLADGVRWLVKHPEEALARIRTGQALVASDYSPETIGRAWKNAVETA